MRKFKSALPHITYYAQNYDMVLEKNKLIENSLKIKTLFELSFTL